ncbi:hypothetical protein OGAPHI_005247 [Ogataea philodendri]|uniref:Uncharacterized protein n=1 Tax=Ogataea philodendri TaxID=1378263 RepID=A0A9P8T357_9ASCO|nr:uncharacterized protein OGAPHI_005247 [Ogataea philodendri]KAH3663844.1 hypothetical protein OGAPHI_005247 [Ogataea philodendri]
MNHRFPLLDTNPRHTGVGIEIALIKPRIPSARCFKNSLIDLNVAIACTISINCLPPCSESSGVSLSLTCLAIDDALEFMLEEFQFAPELIISKDSVRLNASSSFLTKYTRGKCSLLPKGLNVEQKISWNALKHSELSCADSSLNSSERSGITPDDISS